MTNETEKVITHKSHREHNVGRKAEKKKAKKAHVLELTDKQKNPKAFTFNSAIKAERRFRRKQDIETKKQHVPFVDRTPLEPPPILVAVVGPPKVGKSLIIQCLIKSYVRQPLTNIVGPVTVVSGKKRRITFMECNNDINSMIDMAKVADLVLLLVDASFGFEMEIFEFLNICQVHGMPRIMGVLTHLDLIKNAKQMKKTKKTLKHRFWTEVYSGAKLFYLSGLIHGEYLRTEIKNLARFISVMKFKPLTWHTTHAYILADRVEDLTPPELIRQNPKINRTISLYGYVRGIPLNKESSVHIPGCGDLKIKDISFLPDPCPLPEQLKKRALIEKERLIYAPFSGVGGIVYDKDAVYIELGGSHSHLEKKTSLVGALIETQETLDQKLQHSKLQLFSNADPIKSQDITDNFCHAAEIVIDSGRCRRKVVFDNAVSETHNLVVSNSSDDEESEEEESNENSSKEIDSDAIDTDGGTEKIESYSTNETNKSDKVNPVKTDEYQVMNKHRIQDKKRKNEDHKWESVEVKKKRISLSNSKSNNNGSIVEEEEKEKSNDIKVLNNTEIYHSTSKDSDIFIQNKISEALNQLNVRCYKTRERINRESECFDELNDDDSRTGSGEDDPDNPYVVTDEEAKVAEGIINNENDNINKSEESTDSDSSVEDEVKWKENLAGKAKTAFHNRRQSKNLMKVVYGTFDRNTMNKENKKTEEAEDENIEGDGFFRVVQEQQKQKIKERELQNQDECVFFPTTEQNWLNDENKTIVMNRFVTGKWKYTENAEELLKLDDLNEDEFYGDFEDLETGEKHEVKPPKEIVVDEMKEKKKLLEKKRKLKEQFDLEYDNGESKTYYDELKLEVEKQTNLNRSEFEGVDDNVRVQLEGYRPGMYVRVEIESVPCELITHLDPAYPLIIGGLLYGEENVGYVHTRIKKHRWYSKILKSRDPLIFSVGWRRFQTLPVFSKLEDNLRNRMLKYTPEHVACMAHFWGPVTPQSTGILAIQDVATSSSGFRIAATGSIVEMEKSTQIMKKLKLTGVPMKIYKKTAFIKDMFNSALEVAKFEGARIKTVSGIRGQIKKAISKPEGCFRATFEDKILLSDIVFCRTWYKVDVPKFYNPVTSLLLPLKEKNQWQGVKTTGQLKRENNLHAPANKDCMYTPVEREIKVFKPLTIPRSLQKALPYRDKPKIPSVGLRNGGRIAVVREPKEANIAKMMRMIKTNYAHKQKQLKEATKQRIESHQRKIEALEARKLKRQKEMKKHVFRELSKLDKKGKP